LVFSPFFPGIVRFHALEAGFSILGSSVPRPSHLAVGAVGPCRLGSGSGSSSKCPVPFSSFFCFSLPFSFPLPLSPHPSLPLSGRNTLHKAMAHQLPSTLDLGNDVSLDVSTAPTTPGSNLSFSPVLQPADQQPGIPAMKPQSASRSLSSTLFDTTARTPPVRNICCVGAGYVGGPTAAVIAFNNPHIRVTVVDKDEKRIRRWNSVHPPIYEPGLNHILRIARDGAKECAIETKPLSATNTTSSNTPDVSDASTPASECGSHCGDNVSKPIAARQPNLFFTADVAKSISEADIVLIAVNTPTKSRGAGAGSATHMPAFEPVTHVFA